MSMGSHATWYPIRFCAGLTTALRCERRVETYGEETSGIGTVPNLGVLRYSGDDFCKRCYGLVNFVITNFHDRSIFRIHIK